MDLFERRIKSERKFSGRIIQLRYDTVELPDGRISHREEVEHPGGVGIVPVTSDKKILLVKQFRAGPQEPLLEIPAGKLEAGEDPKVCGMRELEEETGFRCGNCKLLSVFYSSPGFTDEKIYVYLATELQK